MEDMDKQLGAHKMKWISILNEAIAAQVRE